MSRLFKLLDNEATLDTSVCLGDCLPADHLVRVRLHQRYWLAAFQLREKGWTLNQICECLAAFSIHSTHW